MDEPSLFNIIVSGFFKPFFYSHRNFPQQNGDQSNYDEDSQSPDSQSSPRDSLLKSNENDKWSRTPSTRKDEDAFHHPDQEDASILGKPSNENTIVREFSSPGFHDGFGGSGDFHSFFGMMDQMMDQMMDRANQFHSGMSGKDFDDSASVFSFPSDPSFTPPPEGERKDTDLDDSSHKAIASLLKKSPPPEHSLDLPPPSSHSSSSSPSSFSSSSRFHSESVVRIQLPDRVIEERRQYRRDGSGKEETEVSRWDSAKGSAEYSVPNIRHGESFADGLFRSFFKGIF